MAQTTSIEWTATRSIGRDGIEVVTPGSTWNPLRGTLGKWSCVKVSPGCTHCYAERMNARFGGPAYRVGADTARLDEKALLEPLRWRTGRKVFVCSMTDLFGEWVTDEQLDRIFAVMALTPQHTYQVLTKRADRMLAYLNRPEGGYYVYDAMFFGKDQHNGAGVQLDWVLKGLGKNDPPWPLPNVWCGVSVEDQQRADERIPLLLRTPAAVRFLSMEPLLGPVTFRDGLLDGIGWVICGGESGGPEARRLVVPCYHPLLASQYAAKESELCPDCEGVGWMPKHQALAWVRSIRDQCVAGSVPYFFKQWGGPTPKSGGRELDGRTWDEMPGAAR